MRSPALCLFVIVFAIVVSIPIERVSGAPDTSQSADRVALRIRFGMKDKTETDWSGKLTPSDGTVEQIRGWRWSAGDSAEGDSFTVATRRGTPQSAAERKRAQAGQQLPLTDNGIIATLWGVGTA